MNKKLLFAAMSLAALTACTNDEFESQKVAEETSPVQFEVVNFNEATTRASMSGNKIVWNANDGDLFTLYHGATNLGDLNGYENATYAAKANDGGTASLTTPTMIKAGAAIMVWPVDTTFRIGSGDNLTLTIPDVQTNIENNIPYVSDQIEIGGYVKKDDTKPATYTNKAGYERIYPVYMRPMASQLIVKADYAKSDEKIAELYTDGSKCPADGGIEEIKVTSVDLLTNAGGTTKFTKTIALDFDDPGDPKDANSIKHQWNAAVTNNAWGKITKFGAATESVAKLTAKEDCLNGNDGCKFLILPQAVIPAAGVDAAAIVVNTIYGKVVVAPNGVQGSTYSDEEVADAWYRYISDPTDPKNYDANEHPATKAGADGKFKTTSEPKIGLMQTINGFSAYAAKSGVAKGEPVGAAATRYVKVLLGHLDMSELHIKDNTQLRNVALVWNHLGVGNTTVFLDGDKDGNFEISQKTIKLINDLNAAAAKEKTPRSFAVKPCQEDGEICKTIVITGASDIQNIQSLTFIADNSTKKADVALKKGETWKWDGTTAKVKQIQVGTGVNSIINKGTLENAADATLAIFNATPSQIFNVPFKNEGTWNIKGGDLNVQFDVTNIGIVNISNGAEYHQDGTGNVFTNDAETLPQRFLTGKATEKFGLVNNSGVLACVNGGNINNYGLIDHLLESAKTYITSNMSLSADGFTKDADFSKAFNKATSGEGNKIGRINLPYKNKDEENVSISNAALAPGFVSVTISTTAGAPEGGKLDLTKVGDYVNYCIIEGGVTEISKVASEIQCIEFNAGKTEIAWKVPAAKYASLIVFSPVNIQRGTTVNIYDTGSGDPINGSVYLKAKMYVGGTTNIDAGKCNGYFGNTSDNFAKMYLTY